MAAAKEMKKDDLKKDAVLWAGPEALKQAVTLLQEFELPLGLLPLEDVVEGGFVKETGYMWITQAKKTEHQFKKIKKLVSYATEVNGFLSKQKISKLHGVKAKELIIWAPVSEIVQDETRNLHFKSFAGVVKTFPADAFAVGE